MSTLDPDLNACLQSTDFLDFEHPAVQAFVAEHVEDAMTHAQKRDALYIAVRDGFRYDPYILDFRPTGLKASDLILREREAGYCVEKAVLYAAALRAVGIPSRLFFGDVKNHIAVDKLVQILGTDRLVFHGGTEVWNGTKWVKATPAFNKELCNRFGVPALEFDGVHDSMFQAYDTSGARFMEYLKDYGTFEDMPFDLYLDTLEEVYGLQGLRGTVLNLREFPMGKA